MKRSILSASLPGTLAALLAFGTGPASGQQVRSLVPTEPESAVVSMEQAGDVLRMTIGHSKLLLADEAFGTIIVGDETIANANIGTGNSIILTALQAGSTNIIVLDEASQGVLMSSTIAVAPVGGPLRSTVTVRNGAERSERYECRGSDCLLVASEDPPTELSFLLSPAQPPREPASEEAAPDTQ